MNGYVKKIGFSLTMLFFIFFIASCSPMSSIMEPEGDAAAKPMISKIEKYKENNGHYPQSLLKLIPDYLPHYDFQAFLYQHNQAQGEKLTEYVKRGLIVAGQGDGYVLKVRFQRYSAECTYTNGQRESCRYIGHH